MNIGIRLFFFDPFFQFLHLFFPFQHQFEILPVIIQIRFMTGIKFFNLHDLVFFLAVGMTDERLERFRRVSFYLLLEEPSRREYQDGQCGLPKSGDRRTTHRYSGFSYR